MTTPNDLTALKSRQEAWASGDYAVVGTTFQIVGEPESLVVPNEYLKS